MISTTTCSHSNPIYWHNPPPPPGHTIGFDSPDEYMPTGGYFAYGSTTCVTDYEYATITPTFTHGELVSGVFLFSLLLIAFFGGIINQVIGVKMRPITKTIIKHDD